MLTQVKITNFQSIAQADLELGSLVVLIGAGDAGKSAVIRAITAALTNSGEDSHIRHGEKKCEVELWFQELGYNDDGPPVGSYPTSTHSRHVRWWKERGKGGCYELSDETGSTSFNKTGGQVPEQVARLFNISTLDIDANTTLRPQLSDQFDPPFLVGEVGSKRARILGKATKLDVVVTAQMNCNKNLAAHRKEADTAREQHTDLDAQLGMLPDYEGFAERLRGAEEILGVVGATAQKLSETAKLAEKLEFWRGQQKSCDITLLQELGGHARKLLVTAEVMEILRLQKVTRDNLMQVWASKVEESTARQCELDKVCEEMGLCQVCGGLRSHEACAS